MNQEEASGSEHHPIETNGRLSPVSEQAALSSSLFDLENFKEGSTFHVRTTHVYDPSKFWVTTKHRELDYFQKFLFKSYYMREDGQRMRPEDIQEQRHCVVFIDCAFYRVRITGHARNHRPGHKIQVFFMDFGMIGTVRAEDVFRCNAKCFEVPAFAVRASLAGVGPHKARAWSAADAVRFSELTSERVLVMSVISVSEGTKTLYVHLWHEDSSIHQVLFKEKRLMYLDLEEEANGVKYPFLLPTHQMLESGKVPTTVSDREYYEIVRDSLLVKRASERARDENQDNN